ncbi:MAG: Hsp20/alpha crystallin family protein [Deltaproteobacteria bacterium]|nr:Hsp20/alpha crystallin family protein [Deltaproteobacteria bacterium]MBW2305815.1 Hsp20/alpha crystallin family protein [Deltaproteobacteria bacterium]
MFDLIPWRRRSEVDPLRRELQELHREMDRMFGRFFGDWFSSEPALGKWSPMVDLSETTDNLVVRVEVPGMSPKDIQISLVGNTLSIKGEKKQEKKEKEENFYRVERSYGSFSRSISLPCDIEQDKVDAAYKDGILTITMPKSETAKAKEIKIDVKS